MESTYAKAYTEVIEILKYLPKSEYEKIPKDKIEFFCNNCDENYNFELDKSLPLESQKISKKTYAILVILFRDYIADDVQKEKLEKILINNDKIQQEEAHEKYNPDNIFKNNLNNNNLNENKAEEINISENNISKNITNENNLSEKNEKITNKTNLVVYKKSWIKNLFDKIKSLFRKK